MLGLESRSRVGSRIENQELDLGLVLGIDTGDLLRMERCELQNDFEKCFPYILQGKSFFLNLRKISRFDKHFSKHLSQPNMRKLGKHFPSYQTNPTLQSFSTWETNLIPFLTRSNRVRG